jgi:uncharacterized protein
MEINKIIAEELKVKETQVEAAVGLLDEGDTVPFIARYRKEKTGGLTDADLRTLEERLTYLRNLDEREKTVIESIDAQGKLTPELKEKILKALTLSEVEDLYRPYKPKRKTRASIAKEKGLEPLALYLKAGKKEKDLKTYAESFMNKEKGVLSYEDALAGAKDILAEEISDNADYRAFVKDEIRTYGFMTSKEIKKEEHDTYGHYASFRAPLPRLRPHQILAMNRGEKEGYLKVGLEYKTDFIKRKIAKDYTFNNVYFVEMNEAIDDALKRLILPSVENEIRSELTEKAEDESIEVFKKNLKSLLMVPPLKNKRVLGFDPGFRTGCKYAFVNENGILEKVGISMITANSKASVERSKEELTELLKKNPVDYIALGNGTASRESEEILRDIVEKNHLPEKIFIVNEAGASVYSASKLGEEEFPDLTVEKRSAVSLARRLQDPLNELVKIDPKSIGVGQYQHDMNQKKLGESLYGVVESCVNEVGVDVNTASVSILSYISGISSSLAKNIVAYLKENGRFEDRNELKKVKLMGPKAYEQCAGFLRIYGGDEELDTTAIHPESYKVAKDVMRLAGIDLLKDVESVKSEKLKSFDEASYLSDHPEVGKPTLDAILEEIVRPGRDIREEAKIVELNREVKDIKDLKPGMILNGTVRNIMDFGLFVDINVHKDGLVYIKEASKERVDDLTSLFSVGDIVKVKVLSVDPEKQRISLSIRQAEE